MRTEKPAPGRPRRAEKTNPQGRNGRRRGNGDGKARERPRERAPGPPSTESERPLILFLCEPGLADLLAKELKYHGIIRQKARPNKFNLRNYDLLVYPGNQIIGDPHLSRLALHALRAPVFGRRVVTDRQLDRLAAAFRRENVDGLVSSVAGASFQRQDLLRWIVKQMRDRHVDFAPQPRHPAWLLVVDHSYWAGFPLFNYHQATSRNSGSERAGALPPTIAAGMVFLAAPRSEDVIWDPVAGSGTLLVEASEMVRGARLLGTDLDSGAVAIAAARLRGKNAVVKVGDSLTQDLARGEVTLVLANLPWGRQHRSDLPLDVLYEGILNACLRNGAPGWRGCFITSDQEAFLRAIERVAVLEIRVRMAVKVRGYPADIFLVGPSAGQGKA